MEDDQSLKIMQLDPEQQVVVESQAPNIVVTACPGSGKTRVLIEKVKWMAQRHDPKRIVAITFTNAAADEMMSRLGDLKIGFCGTAHAFFFKLIQEHRGTDKLVVIGQEDEEEVLKGVKNDLKLKVKTKFLERAMTGNLSSDEGIVWAEFTKRLAVSNCITFDGILIEAKSVLMTLCPQARAHLEEKYECLLIDEYQDASRFEHELYMQFPAVRKFFVGDYNQSIYGWRGSDPDCMARLTRDKNWKNCFLTTNYRSGKDIVSVANTTIYGAMKAVSDVGIVGGMDFVKRADELEFIRQRVAALSENGTVAVLARTNREVDEIRKLLGLEMNVDNLCDGIVLQTLRCLLDPSNEILLRRLLSMKGVHIDELERISKEQSLSHLAGLPPSTPPFEDMQDMITVLCGQAEGVAVGTKMDDYARHDEKPSLAGFVGWLEEEKRSSRAGGNIQVRTVHGAKGQEYDSVILSAPSLTWGVDDEERRLFYVGVTRARKNLVLTSFGLPCCFIEEVQHVKK